MGEPALSEDIVALWSDRRWRLNNLYYIKDKHGNVVLFKMNPARETLRFALDQQPTEVIVTHEPDGFSLAIGTRAIRAHGSISQDGALRATVDGRQRQCRFFASDNGHALFLDGEHYRISQPGIRDLHWLTCLLLSSPQTDMACGGGQGKCRRSN